MEFGGIYSNLVKTPAKFTKGRMTTLSCSIRSIWFCICLYAHAVMRYIIRCFIVVVGWRRCCCNKEGQIAFWKLWLEPHKPWKENIKHGLGSWNRQEQPLLGILPVRQGKSATYVSCTHVCKYLSALFQVWRNLLSHCCFVIQNRGMHSAWSWRPKWYGGTFHLEPGIWQESKYKVDTVWLVLPVWMIVCLA